MGNKWQLKYQRRKRLQAGGSHFLTNTGIPASKRQGEPSILPWQHVRRHSLGAPDPLRGFLLLKPPAFFRMMTHTLSVDSYGTLSLCDLLCFTPPCPSAGAVRWNLPHLTPLSLNKSLVTSHYVM